MDNAPEADCAPGPFFAIAPHVAFEQKGARDEAIKHDRVDVYCTDAPCGRGEINDSPPSAAGRLGQRRLRRCTNLQRRRPAWARAAGATSFEKPQRRDGGGAHGDYIMAAIAIITRAAAEGRPTE